MDNIDVLPLIETSDVISFCNLTIVEDGINSAGVIFYIEPVTNVLALSIDRKRLAVADVIDAKWNELLWELLRTIIVRTVGYDCRHAIGIMEGTNEVVT